MAQRHKQRGALIYLDEHVERVNKQKATIEFSFSFFFFKLILLVYCHDNEVAALAKLGEIQCFWPDSTTDACESYFSSLVTVTKEPPKQKKGRLLIE